MCNSLSQIITLYRNYNLYLMHQEYDDFKTINYLTRL